MDYNNFPTSQTYPKKAPIGSHGSASGTSSATKRISSDIHLFLAQHGEQEFAIREPSSLPSAPSQKKDTKHAINQEAANLNRTFSLQAMPAQEKHQRTSKKEPTTPKKSTDNDSKYAGGGYTTSPNPKALTKPSLSSPVKKTEKKSENKMDTTSPTKSTKQERLNHSMHSYSTPNLMPPMPYPSHSFNMIPMPQAVASSGYYNNSYNNEQMHFDSAFSVPFMTREEANLDLRSRINIM